MATLLDGLLLGVVLAAWGAQVVVPWRLAAAAAAGRHAAAAGPGEELAAPPAGRRLWRLASLPFALAGLLAAYSLAGRNPDAAVARHLVPALASVPGTLLLVCTPALLAAALVATLAGNRLDRGGWRLVAVFGLAATFAAAWAGELLRTGEGPASPPVNLALLVGCRLLLALAAGELFVAGPPRCATAAGVAFLAYLPLLPPAVRQVLWSQGLHLTCAAAALLLLGARWLPAALRRVAVAAGLLLAAVVLAQAGHVSQAMATGIEVNPEPGLQRLR
jgi:hypothetical protein